MIYDMCTFLIIIQLEIGVKGNIGLQSDSILNMFFNISSWFPISYNHMCWGKRKHWLGTNEKVFLPSSTQPHACRMKISVCTALSTGSSNVNNIK